MKIEMQDKIVIPEKIAIRLLNSSEVTAEQFYKYILEQYRILNQLQIQRQQYLQKQHVQLQQLSNGNKFQEIFATATIIQSNPNDLIKKPITPTNGTFLLDPSHAIDDINPDNLPILGTAPVHYRKKSHRKHSGHYRRSNYKPRNTEFYHETPLNPPTPVIQESYTSIPIPLILNSKEDKHPYHHAHAHSHSHSHIRKSVSRKRTTPLTVSDYDMRSSYMNPLLAKEFIFEK